MTQLRAALPMLLLAFALHAAPSHACLNDRDTLAEEIRGLPDVTAIITGRFERNPPLYYQMRIDRLAREIPARHGHETLPNPDTLNDYDDMAVALDRIDRDTEAIAWEEKKRAKLIEMHVSDTDPATKENWYPYYANCGTCWVHRWLKRGADRAKIGEVMTARDLIARAIVIKPNAHEGREKYQLLVMDWIIQRQQWPCGNIAGTDGTASKKASKPCYVPLAYYVQTKTIDPAEAVKGLSGLVVLGAAWESADLFDALGNELQQEPQLKMWVSRLAYLREIEIFDKGGHSLIRDNEDSLYDNAEMEPQFPDAWSSPEITKDFHQLRAEAERWQAKRTAYMMVRLQAGRHPDTDPTFWNDWYDSAPPVVGPPPTLKHKLWNYLGRPTERDADLVYYFQYKLYSLAPYLLVSVVAAGVGIWHTRRRRRRTNADNLPIK